MSTPEMRRPCVVCHGTRTLRVVRNGFSVWEDCDRCRETQGFEPEPSEKEREDAGQLTLGGDV
jgi:hypothetical protein